MGFDTQIEKIPTNITLYLNPRCDDCNKDLEFDSPSDFLPIASQYLQLNNVLHIELEGGYGEYIDVLHTTPHIILCKECADKLLWQSPYFAKAIEKAGKADYNG
jgi:hypothetical protein